MTATTTGPPDTEALAAQVAEPTNAPLPAVPDPQLAAANARIDAAATEAAGLPGVPGRDEFLSLAMQARILSMSGAAPEAVRGNPYVAFHVAMVGRDLGISPSAALELVDIIKSGGQYRLSLSPQLLNGQIRRLGLGSIVPLVQQVDRCVAVALAPGGHADVRCGATWPEHAEGCRCQGILGSTEFTWEEARMAGLVAEGCQPGAHTVKCLNRNSAAWDRCNGGYVTYPKRMMWWRAGGYCADDWFPEAGLGLYSPEELGSVVDAEGRPIDPTTVELPEGYQPKAAEPVAMAGDRAVAELRHDIAALPDEGRQALVAKWTERNDQGTPYLASLGKPGEPTKMPERQVKKARALVDHFMQRAAAGEWGAWERPEPLPSEDSGTPAPEQAGEGEGREVPTPPADPTPVPAAEPTQAEQDAADNEAREALERQLADPPAVGTDVVQAELESIAQQYEALTAHQQTWLAAAIAKVGLRFDQLEASADARVTMRQLLGGAAQQPAEPPQDDLVARTEAIAAKAQAKAAKPAAEPEAPAPEAPEPPVAPTLLDG